MKTQKWTGERLVPAVLNEIAAEHLARYTFTFPFIKNKKVLDLACGEGYGSHLMATVAQHVTGMDIDGKIIAYASAKYKASNIDFTEATALKLPSQDGSFDVVVSFETLEHLTEHHEMLKEIKRVLNTNGLLLISTPNKETYSDKRNFSNKFHQKELTKQEFGDLMKKHFRHYRLLSQQNMYGSFIYRDAATPQKINEATGNFVHAGSENRLSNPSYFIAMASDENLPETDSLFFHLANIYEERFEALKKTWTYKTGVIVLFPFKWLYKLFTNSKA